jgi:hypothetical protein
MVKLTTGGLKSDSGLVLLDTSGTAINTKNTFIRGMPTGDASANYSYHPTFVREGVGGFYEHFMNTEFTYNPQTNTLTAGDVSAKSSATSVVVETIPGVTEVYPTFVSNSQPGKLAIYANPTLLKYNQMTNTLSANISGTADKANTLLCTNINKVSGDFYFSLTNGSATGSYSFFQDQDLSYDPSTGVLTAPKFSGAITGTISGTASNATATTITSVSDDKTYYLTFVDNTSGESEHKIDSSHLTYNPSTNILTSGKFNASGSDFAEYMKKKNGNFQIESGDICGINENGLLTNVFKESFHFCVKSENPAVIAKGNECGPVKGELTEAIAFCGQVPVNIFFCSVGDYIVPIETAEGKISGVNISPASISFNQYRISIGKVIRINEDGRAEIIVKIV